MEEPVSKNPTIPKMHLILHRTAEEIDHLVYPGLDNASRLAMVRRIEAWLCETGFTGLETTAELARDWLDYSHDSIEDAEEE